MPCYIYFVVLKQKTPEMIKATISCIYHFKTQIASTVCSVAIQNDHNQREMRGSGAKSGYHRGRTVDWKNLTSTLTRNEKYRFRQWCGKLMK